MPVTREYHSWIETDNATNATATATRAATSGARSHYVTSIAASFSGSVAGVQLVLNEGATEIGRWYVHDVFALVFPSPIKIDPGNATSLVLSAGGAGVVGSVTLNGYTV